MTLREQYAAAVQRGKDVLTAQGHTYPPLPLLPPSIPLVWPVPIKEVMHPRGVLSGKWQTGLHNQAYQPSVTTQAHRQAKQAARAAAWCPVMLAAWAQLTPPRTIKALAAKLGEVPSTVQNRILRCGWTRARLNAALVAATAG